MSDREFVELFNSCLLDISPLAPPVDAEEFCRLRAVLDCSEKEVLFILGTHVTPDQALAQNAKYGSSMRRGLGRSFKVKGIKRNLVTHREFADYFMIPTEDVNDAFELYVSDAIGSGGYFNSVFERWEKHRWSLLARGVDKVIWGSGKNARDVQAVRVLKQDAPDGEFEWFSLGQRVRMEGPRLERPVEGVIDHIDGEYGTAHIVPTEGDAAWPEYTPRLTSFENLIPLEETGFEHCEPLEGSAGDTPCSYMSDEALNCLKDREEADNKRTAEKLLADCYPPNDPFVPFSYSRLDILQDYAACDSETAFYVFGAHMPTKYVCVVNRQNTSDGCQHAIREFKRDVITIGEIAEYFMQPEDMIRRQLVACGFDLSSSEGQAYVAQWQASHRRMREHGVKEPASFGIRRDRGMGSNEAHAVVFCRKGNDAESVLIVGKRARVDQGTFAGLEGVVVSLAPEDGLAGVSLTVDGESDHTLSALVRFEDVEMLLESEE